MMLSSAIRDPSRRVSGLNVPVQSSRVRTEAHPSDKQSAAPTAPQLPKTPVREEHQEITPHLEPAQPRRSVAKRLFWPFVKHHRSGQSRGGRRAWSKPTRHTAPQVDTGLDTAHSRSLNSVSQPHGDLQGDDSRIRIRCQSQSLCELHLEPPLPPHQWRCRRDSGPLTPPAAPAFSTARRALQPRVHDEANRSHPGLSQQPERPLDLPRNLRSLPPHWRDCLLRSRLNTCCSPSDCQACGACFKYRLKTERV